MLLKVEKALCHGSLKILEENIIMIINHVIENDYQPPAKDTKIKDELPPDFQEFIERALTVKVDYKPIRIQLNELLRWSEQELRKFRVAFEHDKQFVNHIIGTGTYFQIRDLDIREKAKDFMVPFYERLGGGYVFKDPDSPENKEKLLDRAGIINSYIEANRPKKRHLLCPACLEDLRPMTSKGILADLDHYFPKSLYPTLAINGDNLIPVCMSCNQRLKGDRDPFKPTEESEVGCFSTIYLPFHRDAIRDIEVTFKNNFGKIDLSVSDLDESWISEKVCIHSKRQDDDPLAERAVRQLNDIYQLEAQWEGRLEGIFTDLLNDIKFELGANLASPSAVKSLLIMEYERVRRKATSSPNAYLTGCYIRYLLDSPKRVELLSRELNEWAQEQIGDDDVLAEYRSMFDDVLGDLHLSDY